MSINIKIERKNLYKIANRFWNYINISSAKKRFIHFFTLCNNFFVITRSKSRYISLFSTLLMHTWFYLNRLLEDNNYHRVGKLTSTERSCRIENISYLIILNWVCSRDTNLLKTAFNIAVLFNQLKRYNTLVYIFY